MEHLLKIIVVLKVFIEGYSALQLASDLYLSIVEPFADVLELPAEFAKALSGGGPAQLGLVARIGVGAGTDH